MKYNGEIKCFIIEVFIGEMALLKAKISAKQKEIRWMVSDLKN
jgi:hypothetical protein